MRSPKRLAGVPGQGPADHAGERRSRGCVAGETALDVLFGRHQEGCQALLCGVGDIRSTD